MNNLKRNLIGSDKLLHSKVGNCMLVLFFALFFKFWSVGTAFFISISSCIISGAFQRIVRQIHQAHVY